MSHCIGTLDKDCWKHGDAGKASSVPLHNCLALVAFGAVAFGAVALRYSLGVVRHKRRAEIASLEVHPLIHHPSPRLALAGVLCASARSSGAAG